MGFIGNYAMNLAAITAGREPVRPLLFSYYVTHRCALGCGYCSDGEGRRFRDDPVAELTTEEAVELVSMLARSGDTLDITGGEPMLRTDIEDILEFAKSAGMRTVLNTKAVGLSERPGILEHADMLVVGVDSLDRSRLAKIIGRDGETAGHILDGLKFAVEERRRTGTCIVLSCVITPENIGDVESVLDYAAGNGLGFHVSPEIIGKRANLGLRENTAYRNTVDNVRRSKRDGLGVLGVHGYLEGIRDFSRFKCHPLLMPVIRPDGRLYYPCLESGQAEVRLADYGSYEDALRASRERYGAIPNCRDCCHIFCHMALSLLQRNPLSALLELRSLRAAKSHRNNTGTHVAATRTGKTPSC